MRIIAGTLRGRRLVAPKGLATRPTTDRVREAWFSILHRVSGRVVDIYAGTGALGFEALSRGAEHVVFVESAGPAQDAILQNAQSLGVSDRVTLLRLRAERSLTALLRAGPFELVLTDPPWTALADSGRTLDKLITAGLVAPGGRVVLGHPRAQLLHLSEPRFKQVSTRAWGDSAATFYELSRSEVPDAQSPQTPAGLQTPAAEEATAPEASPDAPDASDASDASDA